MIKGRSLQEHISEKMKDPEFKKAWNDLDAEFEKDGLNRLNATDKKNGVRIPEPSRDQSSFTSLLMAGDKQPSFPSSKE